MTREEYLQAYSPVNQYIYALHERRCHRGAAPSIMQSVAQQGIETTVQAIETLIDDFISFTPAKGRMTAVQRRQLSFVIITQFKQLKITQLILFFVKAKGGAFGKFYTVVEPMDITIALRQWVVTCEKELNEYYHERAQQMKEEELSQQQAYEDEMRDTYERTIMSTQKLLRL